MPRTTAPTPPPRPPARLRVCTVEWHHPFRWLVLAWRDVAQCTALSLMHGLLVTLAGGVLVVLTHNRFWLLAGLLSTFLIIAPLLATSLYALSRALEQGQRPSLEIIIATWTRWQHHRQRDPQGYWCLVHFGLLLGLAAAGWATTSAAFITLLAPAPVLTPADFIHTIVLAQDHWLFESWMALGALMAAPMFASSVITIPLLLDRQVNTTQAIVTSWQVVLANPAAMAFWAFVLMGFTLLGLASLLLGMVLVVPMLGHASWHAYRDLVDASALPERLPQPAADPTGH
jgi:uncharacterized membrane protein